MAEEYQWQAGRPIQSYEGHEWQAGKPYIVLHVLPTGDVTVIVSVVDGVFQVLPITFQTGELFAILFKVKPRDRVFEVSPRDRMKKIKSRKRIFDAKY